MKKVAIIEIGGSHTENIHSLVFLLRKQQCSIHLICNESLWKLFPDASVFDGHLLVPDSFTATSQITTFLKIRSFLKSNLIEAAIFGTTEITIIRNLIFFLPKKCIYTGIVHNAEKLESGSTMKNIIFRRVKKFIVLSNYLYENASCLSQYQVASLLPIYFPKPSGNIALNNSKNQLIITIPGSVENVRRDYIPFFKALKNYAFNEHILFVLLGKFDKEKEVAIANELESVGVWKNAFVLFNGFLDYDTFHSYIAKSACIMPLLKLENDSFYGDYRVSGSINLGLGYQLPFIMPENYQHNKDSNAYSIYYKNYQELFDLLFNKSDSLHSALNRIKLGYKDAWFNDTEKVSKQLAEFVFKS